LALFLDVLPNDERHKMSTDKQTVTTELPELLTETQVSERYNVKLSTLRYWRQCGAGPDYIKMEKLVRYDVAALRSYFQRNLRVSKARATSEEQRVAP
jgi:hypothetical protein